MQKIEQKEETTQSIERALGNLEEEARMASRAAHRMFDGSITANDTDIQWRPYRPNFGCALHKLKGGSSHDCFQPRNIAFPKKQWQSDCSLLMAASKFSSQSSSHPDDLALLRKHI
ncbi:hypothetical protein SLEP1_g10445 [Rubroshorea leprosula]|uniref:Uncharacterized protein n=1 Tax=Rubroshorea leprosula TaxID=152421 RepID=A0AAV5IHJ2_9ROSI|nr:hypothetical protein SLEP1_g10445 [Rubroshorea leprosula]